MFEYILTCLLVLNDRHEVDDDVNAEEHVDHGFEDLHAHAVILNEGDSEGDEDSEKGLLYIEAAG